MIVLNDLYSEWMKSGAPSLAWFPAAIGLYNTWGYCHICGWDPVELSQEQAQHVFVMLAVNYHPSFLKDMRWAMEKFYDWLIESETRRLKYNPFKNVRVPVWQVQQTTPNQEPNK